MHVYECILLGKYFVLFFIELRIKKKHIAPECSRIIFKIYVDSVPLIKKFVKTNMKLFYWPGQHVLNCSKDCLNNLHSFQVHLIIKVREQIVFSY